MVGYIPTSTLPATTTGCFIVQDDVKQVFLTGFKPDSATGFITEINGADTNTNNGYSLYSTMYRLARVRKMRLRVSCLPTSLGDQTHLSVFATPAGLVPPISYTFARAQRNYKETVAVNGTPLKDCSVDIEVCAWDVMGMTETEWMSQPPVVVAGGASTPTWYIFCQYFACDASTNVNTIPFRIEVAQEVEYFDPIPRG